MNNEAIQRLREPAAWALLGAVAAVMLGALIYVFGGEPDTGSGGSARAFVDIGGHVVGPGTVALILAAVALVLTGPNRSPRTFGIVLMAMIELGVGALLGVISLIMGFVAYSDTLANAFQHFFVTGANLAVVVFAGLFLIRVFGDPNLVPRSAPNAYPATGAQQAFGQQQPGYVTGAQPGAAQTGSWPQQPQAGAAQTGSWPQQGDAYAQAGTAQGDAQQGYDQAAYGQQYQQGYDQQASYSQTGGQQAAAGYDQAAYGQQYQQGYDQQASYSQTGGQQAAAGYDQAAYGQQYQQGYDQQASYSQTGGQQAAAGYDQAAYGQQYQQGYDQQASYSQTGGQQAAAGYDQAAYGQQYQQGYDQQASYSQTGGQQAAAGYDQAAYGQQYQQGSYPAADSESTLVQPAVSDPSPGSYPAGDDVLSGERAAQDAIQHGWSQPSSDSADSQSGKNPAYTDPAQGGQYGSGGYAAPSYETSGGYPSEQQRHSGSETDGSWSGQYRDDNRP
ncbi:hypothetical protein ABH917_004783 [Thermobifida halotolerans]|uniref:hypothetical protein n=1 Tax=Thermobifida halotolerans TaxID=483545 RepID=UPI001FB1BB1D|nr:hypothetical protein [Thermobifida halotolerans]